MKNQFLPHWLFVRLGALFLHISSKQKRRPLLMRMQKPNWEKSLQKNLNHRLSDLGQKLVILVGSQLVSGQGIPLDLRLWVAHWLTLSGRYRWGIKSLRYIQTVSEKPGSLSIIHAYQSCFLAYYYFCRGFYSRAEKSFSKCQKICIQLNNDGWIYHYNRFLWAQLYTYQNHLDKFCQIVRADSLHNNTSLHPDFAAKTHALSAYLHLKQGEVEVGKKQWQITKEKALSSSSSSDLVYFYTTSSLLSIFKGDKKQALKDNKSALKSLRRYGHQAHLWSLLRLLRSYLKKPSSVLRLSRRNPGLHLCAQEFAQSWPQNHTPGFRSQAEETQWFYNFFEQTYNTYTHFKDLKGEDVLQRIRLLCGCSKFQVCSKAIKDTPHPAYQVNIGKSGTELQFNIILENQMYEVDLTTFFLPWRNPDAYLAIKTLIVSLQGISFNLYHQKQLSEKLKNEQLLFSFKQIAHDLRSPISALTILSQNITGTTEAQRKLLQTATRRISEIVQQLNGPKMSLHNSLNKQLSTPHADNPSFLVKIADLQNACAEVVSEMRFVLKDSPIKIKMMFKNLEDAAPEQFVDLNLTSLKRALSNLIINSIEACENEGLVAIMLDYKHDSISLHVRDSGCGIPQDCLAKIFNPGFSMEKDTGSGLGLYYVNSFCQSIQAKISVDSTVNLGTDFTIDIPLKSATEQALLA